VSDHDPLCEWSTPCIHGENQQHSRDTENLAVPDATYCWMCGADCLCDLIAKVREAERDGIDAVRLRTAFNEQGYRDGQRDMLVKCIALIEESVPWSTENWIAVDERAAILTALRALQEKP